MKGLKGGRLKDLKGGFKGSFKGELEGDSRTLNHSSEVRPATCRAACDAGLNMSPTSRLAPFGNMAPSRQCKVLCFPSLTVL